MRIRKGARQVVTSDTAAFRGLRIGPTDFERAAATVARQLVAGPQAVRLLAGVAAVRRLVVGSAAGPQAVSAGIGSAVAVIGASLLVRKADWLVLAAAIS